MTLNNHLFVLTVILLISLSIVIIFEHFHPISASTAAGSIIPLITSEFGAPKQRACYKFLDSYYSSSDWKIAQNIATCFIEKGFWMKMDSLYKRLCFQETWKSCTRADRALGLNYQWSIDSRMCYYSPEDISLSRMCLFMNGSTLMIIGDSISSQFGTSLMNRMAMDDSKQCDPDIGFFSTGLHEIRCYHLGFPNFRYNIVRNDRLSLVKQRKFTNGTKKFADFVENQWINLINISEPSIVVLNRGSHFEETAKVIKDLTLTMNYITKNFPDTAIVWRNTPRGVEHYNYTFFAAPLIEPPDPNRPSSLPYAYEKFNKQGIEVKNYLEKYYPKVIYWDIAFPMSFRVDGHKDPLHYCFPGPMDSWPYFLYNILRIFKTNIPSYDTMKDCVKAKHR